MLVRGAWIFSALVRSRDLPLRLAQDDFYYYLKPAQNLAWHHVSAFFDHVPTNGYHPLYFFLLTCVSLFVHTLPGVFRFLCVLDLLSLAAIFFLSRRIFAQIAPPLLANALAVAIAAVSLTQICNQMEVTLALPFGFAFLAAAFIPGRELTSRRAALIGLFAALTFLSRLDSGLLVFFYVLAALCTREYRKAFTPKVIAAFFAALLPLPLLYFSLNKHFFHTLLPISGMAKELRHAGNFSVLLPASFSGTSELLVNAALVAGVLAWALRRYLAAREKVFIFAVCLTPFVFYGLEMLISDWPVWNWYFYITRFSAAGLGVVIAVFFSRVELSDRYLRLGRMLRSPALLTILCVGALGRLYLANYNVDHWMVEVQHAAGILDAFANTHPGVYAMGDRAGMFAISQPNPVLQTEGLVMDKPFLEHIRNQDDLRSVLASYGVNYYVVFAFKTNYSMQFTNGCFHAMEPSIAGPAALRMRSDFCEPPLYQFPGFDGKYMIFRIKP